MFWPVAIDFKEAIPIAALGLIVNVASALLLSGGNQDHGQSHDAITTVTIMPGTRMNTSTRITPRIATTICGPPSSTFWPMPRSRCW